MYACRKSFACIGSQSSTAILRRCKSQADVMTSFQPLSGTRCTAWCLQRSEPWNIANFIGYADVEQGLSCSTFSSPQQLPEWYSARLCWAAAPHGEQLHAACHDDIAIDPTTSVQPGIVVHYILHMPSPVSAQDEVICSIACDWGLHCGMSGIDFFLIFHCLSLACKSCNHFTLGL